MDDSSTDRGFDLLINKGKLEAHVVSVWPANAIQIEAKQALADNRWHHVAVTYDGSAKAAGVKLYADGRPIEVNVTVDTLTATSKTETPLLVGRRSKTVPFKGSIDDARVYASALAPKDINNIADIDPIRDILALPAGQRTAGKRAVLRDEYLKTADAEYQNLIKQLTPLREQQAKLNAAIPTVMAMQEISPPRKTFILKRGQYNAPSDEVTAGNNRRPPAHAQRRTRQSPGPGDVAHRSRSSANQPRSRQQILVPILRHRFSKNHGRLGRTRRTAQPSRIAGLASLHFIETSGTWKLLQRINRHQEERGTLSRFTPDLIERDPENRLLARGPRSRLKGRSNP